MKKIMRCSVKKGLKGSNLSRPGNRLIRTLLLTVLIALVTLSAAPGLAAAKPVTPVISQAAISWNNNRIELTAAWTLPFSTVKISGFEAEVRSANDNHLIKSITLKNTAKSVTIVLSSNEDCVFRIRSVSGAGWASVYSGYGTSKKLARITVLIKSLSDSTNRRNIVIGHTKSLSVSVSPSGMGSDVTWKSSNPSIASVDANGKVTGKKYGKVTISAESKSCGGGKAMDFFVYPYSIADAVNYAERFWSANDGDQCAAYVSTAIGSGRSGVKGGGIGIPRTTTTGPLASTLTAYSFGMWNPVKVTNVSQIKKGDILFYKVKVGNIYESSFRHVVLCVAVSNGVPLIDSHNNAQHMREYGYYWLKDSSGQTHTGDVYVIQLADGL